MKKPKHTWTFRKSGGVDQVVLKSGEDLLKLHELDLKLWLALACPTKGTEIDEETLKLIDTDHDSRIRPPEILAAIESCGEVFKSLDFFFKKGASVPLSEVDEDHEAGQRFLRSAERVLADVGKRDEKEICLDDVAAMGKAFAATRFNGDGIVPADAATEPETQAAIEDVMTAQGSLLDRSGKQGVDRERVETFAKHADELLAWYVEGDSETVNVVGNGKTKLAFDALVAVEEKLVDFYTRGRLAAFDARGATALNPADADLQSLTSKTLSSKDDGVERLPIAHVEALRALPLSSGLNPAWAERVQTFAKVAVEPILGARSELKESDFQTIVAKLEPFRKWSAAKPTTGAVAVARERLSSFVDGGFKNKILDLVEQDLALAPDYEKITAVEKAVRLRRDLVPLLRNFVNFSDFYGGRGGAFQAGTLYLDGRSCDLVVFVQDAGKHAALAGLSKAYLTYCDCMREGEKVAIAAAFTAGDVDNLMVGRNGVFYDRKGRDWDATITSIISNPISIRQAFWTPYKRLIHLIEEQVAKRAAEKEKASSERVDAAALATVNSAQGPTPAPGAPGAAAPGAPAPAPAAPAVPPAAPGTAAAAEPSRKLDVGMLAALSIAIAGVATFLSGILMMFLDLGIWMPVGIAGVLLAISGPSMLIAWLKLRQRNLGPILDANGWAVNGRVRINIPFGGSLTSLAKLPEGSTHTLADPYAEKPTPWIRYVVFFVLLMLGLVWILGKADPYLPDSVRSDEVLHRTHDAKPDGSAKPADSAAPPAPAK
ncbi:MAG: hypothetical protein HOW73_35695 [Polyangiaceae bacterium]|nr:hypothetical protein [Polyangiaceae bacterium]